MDRAPLRLGRRRLLAMAVAAAADAAVATMPPWPVRRRRAPKPWSGIWPSEVWALLQSGDLDQRTRLDQLTGLLAVQDRRRAAQPPGSGPALAAPDARPSRRATRSCSAQVVLRNLARRLDQYANGATGRARRSTFASPAASRSGKHDVLVRSTVTTRRATPWASTGACATPRRRPVIIDLIIEGVSLLVAQRSEFAAVIERSDMDGLLAELQARATSES